MRDQLLLKHAGLEEVAGELKWVQHPRDLGLHLQGALFPPVPHFAVLWSRTSTWASLGQLSWRCHRPLHPQLGHRAKEQCTGRLRHNVGSLPHYDEPFLPFSCCHAGE